MSSSEQNTTPNLAPRKPRRRWRKPLLLATLVLLIVVGTPAALYLYHSRAADAALEEALAETDRHDPGWRLEDLEAKRRVIPDAENAALRVLAAAKHLPKNWEDRPPSVDLPELPPVQLYPEDAKALRAERKLLEPVLVEARKLSRLPAGRYPITWTPNFIDTLIPHIPKARMVASLLEWDATLLAHDGDMAGAIDRCQACLNAGRSIGDEPLLISLLVRVAIRSIAVKALERTVAQGQPPPASLAAAQKALEEAARDTALVTALRGERAGQHSMMANVESGKITLSEVTGGKPERGFWNSVSGLWVTPRVKHSHAWMLNYLTEVIEVAQKPAPEREARLRQLEAAVTEAPPLARALCTALSKVADADTRGAAVSGCAIAGLASERYRREHGRWPESLDELVRAGFLQAVPTDPYDGGQLRFRQAKDGVVIYSIGAEGTYDGTALDDGDLDPVAVRPEFRLWDVDRRRQPPLPPRPPAGKVEEGAAPAPP